MGVVKEMLCVSHLREGFVLRNNKKSSQYKNTLTCCCKVSETFQIDQKNFLFSSVIFLTNILTQSFQVGSVFCRNETYINYSYIYVSLCLPRTIHGKITSAHLDSRVNSVMSFALDSYMVV